MLAPLALVVAIATLLASTVVAAYAAAQVHLLLCGLGESRPAPPLPPEDALPTLTVQLPIRNERRVVLDLLEAVAALDWPRDRLEVQVLDDSDDETVALCAERCRSLAAEGLPVVHLRRGTREGFKAGALAWGLERARGELIAIFDADFRPAPDFLRRAAAPLLADPGLGLVQARWGHLDRDRSALTRAQALHLDAHFGVEQRARGLPLLWMGFNGTAGLWRRTCIEAAGGWSATSLTEDLDLAYRAQLAGWRLTYRDELEAPAELPDDFPAVRAQQHRWMKGGAQVCRLLATRVARADAPWTTRIQGLVHLGGGAVVVAMAVLLVLTPAGQLLADEHTGVEPLLGTASALLQASFVAFLAVYGAACARREGLGAGLRRLVRDLPVFLGLSAGLALHGARAVVEGWLGRTSPFVRTPKRGREDAPGRLYAAETDPMAVLELGLAAWGAVGLALALAEGRLPTAVFLALQVLGCAAVGLGSLGWLPEPSVEEAEA